MSVAENMAKLIIRWIMSGNCFTHNRIRVVSRAVDASPSLGRQRKLLRVKVRGRRREPAQHLAAEHLARGVPAVHRDPHVVTVVVGGEDADDEPDAVPDADVLGEVVVLGRINHLLRVEARVVARLKVLLGSALALVTPLPVLLLAVPAAVTREVALGAELVGLVRERALAAHVALHAEGLRSGGEAGVGSVKLAGGMLGSRGVAD